jgi:hypothetical protein
VHSLRATAAINALAREADIAKVQELLAREAMIRPRASSNSRLISYGAELPDLLRAAKRIEGDKFQEQWVILKDGFKLNDIRNPRLNLDSILGEELYASTSRYFQKAERTALSKLGATRNPLWHGTNQRAVAEKVLRALERFLLRRPDAAKEAYWRGYAEGVADERRKTRGPSRRRPDESPPCACLQPGGRRRRVCHARLTLVEHHIIPQFYLRGFRDPAIDPRRGPRVWTADLKLKTVTQRSPKTLAKLTTTMLSRARRAQVTSWRRRS